MNDMNVKKPIPFHPPVVSIAYPDGLLKTADINAPIPVEVEVWPAAEPGYTVRLDLDGRPVTKERVITESDNPGDIMTLELAEGYLQEDGIYSLQYRTYSPYSDWEDFSPAIPLKVDRTSPGAALLAPLIFPEPTSGDTVTGLIPGYAGMEPGDTIQTLCNGVSGPSHTVQADELTVRPVEIAFDREWLNSLASDNVMIAYTVTDRAGNPSIMSQPVALSLTV